MNGQLDVLQLFSQAIQSANDPGLGDVKNLELGHGRIHLGEVPFHLRHVLNLIDTLSVTAWSLEGERYELALDRLGHIFALFLDALSVHLPRVRESTGLHLYAGWCIAAICPEEGGAFLVSEHGVINQRSADGAQNSFSTMVVVSPKTVLH